MAGFNFELGRSNNMVAAESRGMITIGRWAKRFKVTAAAAVAVMQPPEAHHTGTGRRGKSRLTQVIDSAVEPTAEQIETMRDFDRAAKAAKEAPPTIVEDCAARYITWPTTRGARRVPTEHVKLLFSVEMFADGTVAATELVEEFRAVTPEEIAAHVAAGKPAWTAPRSVCTGRLVAGRRTTGWEKLSGLVVARDGEIVYTANVNAAYDNAAAIAKRICE